jgi:excisionase family DNA binding protein
MERNHTAQVCPSRTQLISINDAAKRLGVCRKTVENLIGRKQLRTVRIGRRVMIRESDLESFIRRRMR